MKQVTLLSIFFAMAISFSSCKKCAECKATNGPNSAAEVKMEKCANKEQRAAFEDAFETTYRASGYEVKCEQK